jgi:hypothetical protein
METIRSLKSLKPVDVIKGLVEMQEKIQACHNKSLKYFCDRGPIEERVLQFPFNFVEIPAFVCCSALLFLD